METTQKANSFFTRIKTIKEKITHNTIILLVGILLSSILFLIEMSSENINWKTPPIPLMIALQIIFLLVTIKNRYKKP